MIIFDIIARIFGVLSNILNAAMGDVFVELTDDGNSNGNEHMQRHRNNQSEELTQPTNQQNSEGGIETDVTVSQSRSILSMLRQMSSFFTDIPTTTTTSPTTFLTQASELPTRTRTPSPPAAPPPSQPVPPAPPLPTQSRFWFPNTNNSPTHVYPNNLPPIGAERALRMALEEQYMASGGNHGNRQRRTAGSSENYNQRMQARDTKVFSPNFESTAKFIDSLWTIMPTDSEQPQLGNTGITWDVWYNTRNIEGFNPFLLEMNRSARNEITVAEALWNCQKLCQDAQQNPFLLSHGLTYEYFDGNEDILEESQSSQSDSDENLYGLSSYINRLKRCYTSVHRPARSNADMDLSTSQLSDEQTEYEPNSTDHGEQYPTSVESLDSSETDEFLQFGSVTQQLLETLGYYHTENNGQVYATTKTLTDLTNSLKPIVVYMKRSNDNEPKTAATELLMHRYKRYAINETTMTASVSDLQLKMHATTNDADTETATTAKIRNMAPMSTALTTHDTFPSGSGVLQPLQQQLQNVAQWQGRQASYVKEERPVSRVGAYAGFGSGANAGAAFRSGANQYTGDVLSISTAATVMATATANAATTSSTALATLTATTTNVTNECANDAKNNTNWNNKDIITAVNANINANVIANNNNNNNSNSPSHLMPANQLWQQNALYNYIFFNEYQRQLALHYQYLLAQHIQQMLPTPMQQEQFMQQLLQYQVQLQHQIQQHLQLRLPHQQLQQQQPPQPQQLCVYMTPSSSPSVALTTPQSPHSATGSVSSSFSSSSTSSTSTSTSASTSPALMSELLPSIGNPCASCTTLLAAQTAVQHMLQQLQAQSQFCQQQFSNAVNAYENILCTQMLRQQTIYANMAISVLRQHQFQQQQQHHVQQQYLYQQQLHLQHHQQQLEQQHMQKQLQLCFQQQQHQFLNKNIQHLQKPLDNASSIGQICLMPLESNSRTQVAIQATPVMCNRSIFGSAEHGTLGNCDTIAVLPSSQMDNSSIGNDDNSNVLGQNTTSSDNNNLSRV